MIRRYRNGGALIYIPTLVASNTLASSTSHSVTYTTKVTGEPGSIVGFKVTTYAASGGASPNYQVNGTSHVLNDTFNLTLDGSGQVTFTQLVDVGTTTSGNSLDVILTIETTSIGYVSGSANNTNISKTV